MESKAEEVKESLKLLIELQEKDTVIGKLKKRAEAIPQQIEEQKALLEQYRSTADDSKKRLTQLQLQRKEKELEVDTKDTEIRKHSNELNAVKTNDAYRALLTEIEKCKADKSVTEDAILALMEEAEQETAVIKEKEKAFKEKESEFKAVITASEAELANLQAEISKLESERNEFAGKIAPELLHHYEYIRDARDGSAIVSIEGETCGGCHFTLRPQEINEVYKGQALIVCDSCSRILYKKHE